MMIPLIFCAFLPKYNEIIGNLVEVKTESDVTKLIFTVEKEIEIPSDPEFEEKIKRYVGKKIGIFHIDGEYKIRVCDESKGGSMED